MLGFNELLDPCLCISVYTTTMAAHIMSLRKSLPGVFKIHQFVLLSIIHFIQSGES